MNFTHAETLNQRKTADILVLPFWKDNQNVLAAASLDKNFNKILNSALASGDFKGQEGEIVYLYLEEQPEKRFCLLGLGSKDKATVENLRRAYGSFTKSCTSKKCQSLNLLLPEHDQLKEQDLIRGIAEGLLLPNYLFNQYKSQKSAETDSVLIENIAWIGSQSSILSEIKRIASLCEAVYYTRDLVNGNADDITPQYLAECAKNLAKQHPSIKTTVFDKKRIEKEKLNLLLAVNRGSNLDPAFIIIEYRGQPQLKDHTVIVGKGVTYDTGGLNLKPTGGMETMKCDMGGAAACIGTVLAASSLNLKVNLTAVIPTTENGIDAKSFKPGDVYTSYAGTTVEMTNSDAEGRLILADALAYACQNLKPTRLIDLATLTGAIEVALGSEASGIMSTNDELAQNLCQASERTFERLWRMPLYDEYKERLKSDIADIKSWNGRSGSANVAATFLRHFVDDAIPWAHIDIAGTAFLSEAKKYVPKYATGFGVRLLIEFLEGLQAKESIASLKEKKKSNKV